MSMNSFISEKFTVEPVSNIDHIERSFCTNFSCCNILLPDLHALFAHYDTQHLPHLLPPKYLPPPALHLDLSSDESDSCSASPSPSIPSTPSTPHHVLSSTPPKIALSAYHNPFSEAEHEDVPLFDDSYLIPEYPTYEQCYNAAIAPPGSPFSFSPSSSTLSSPTSATFPLPVTDSFYPPPPSPPSGSGLPEQPLDPGATCTTLLSATGIRSHPQIPHPSAGTNPANSAPGSPYPRPTGVGGSHYKKPRDREKKSSAAKYLGRKKLYTCPTPGCSKVYLNPNGLKYHQEKGRCKIEEGADAAAMDVYPTATVAPVVAEPSSPLPVTATPASSSLPTAVLSQQNGAAQSQPQLAYHPLYFALPVFQPPKPVAKPEPRDDSPLLPQETVPNQPLFQPQALEFVQATTATTETEVMSSSASC